MNVRIKLFEGHIVVTESGVDYQVRPGDKWRGWKYNRLRRKGEGEHVLLSSANKPQVGGRLQLRGHK